MHDTDPLHHHDAVIDRAIKRLAVSQAELARRLGEKPQNLNNWRRRGIPLGKALRFVEVTGVGSCHALYPHAFPAIADGDVKEVA